MKRITRETFEKILKVTFTRGFSGNIEKWDENEFFVGWLPVYKDAVNPVVCINEDSGGVVLWVVYRSSDTPSLREIKMYFYGILKSIDPDLMPEDEDDFEDEEGETVCFMYEKE